MEFRMRLRTNAAWAEWVHGTKAAEILQRSSYGPRPRSLKELDILIDSAAGLVQDFAAHHNLRLEVGKTLLSMRAARSMSQDQHDYRIFLGLGRRSIDEPEAYPRKWSAKEWSEYEAAQPYDQVIIRGMKRICRGP